MKKRVITAVFAATMALSSLALGNGKTLEEQTASTEKPVHKRVQKNEGFSMADAKDVDGTRNFLLAFHGWRQWTGY